MSDTSPPIPGRPSPEKRKGERLAVGCAVLVVIAVVAIFIAKAYSSSKPPQTAPNPSAALSTPGTPSAEQQGAFLADGKSFTSIMGECDDAVEGVSRVLKRRDIYEAYSATARARDTCSDVGGRLGEFQFSSLFTSVQRAKLEEMREPCETAYLMRAAHMDAAAKVMNGDQSPAAVDTVKQTRDAADYQAVICVNDMLPASHAAGFNGWTIIPGGSVAE
jgi:hypothetical protein